jgi:hypothetical protein
MKKNDIVREGLGDRKNIPRRESKGEELNETNFRKRTITSTAAV